MTDLADRITGPVTKLLGSGPTTVISIVFVMAAIFAISMADRRRLRGVRSFGVTVLAVLMSVILGVAATKLAEPAKGAMPTSRVIEIFSGALSYGTLIWIVGMVLVVILTDARAEPQSD